jgi:8-oxo-dGTP diphosphatase
MFSQKINPVDKQTEYYESLPRKRMGSGVVIRNSRGEMLILKTTYKSHWEIPGGVVEENESPKQAAEREALEEIGLTIKIASCLVVHYRSAQDKQNENIMFVFDGGVIADDTKIRLDGKEISEARFVSFQNAASLVGERIASRLPFCEQALKEKRMIYLESIGGLKPTLSG